MTSMPASRSAAATTLAPRSCPSSPGLPTSTRILRCMLPPATRTISSPHPGARTRAATLARLPCIGHAPRPRVRSGCALALAALLVGKLELRGRLQVDAARLGEVLGGGRHRAAVLVLAQLDDVEALEQVLRGVRRFGALETERDVLAVAAQGLQQPRALFVLTPHAARAAEVSRRPAG